MKTLRICLAALTLTGSPMVLAEHDDPGILTRAIRGVGAFFGAETDVRAEGRFTNDETILIRDALAARAQARAQQHGEYDGRHQDARHHDYDDDEDGHKGRPHGKKPKKLPPGLKKKVERGDELPPGWQRKFERGEVVSDDVWLQSRAVPESVVDRIQRVSGTEIIQVGDRVARVRSGNREIIDVIDLIAGP